MRNIFLGKSYTKCRGEACPRPFYETLKLGLSLDRLSDMLCNLFLFYVQVVIYQNISEYQIIKNIKGQKVISKGLNPVSLHHFPHDSA